MPIAAEAADAMPVFRIDRRVRRRFTRLTIFFTAGSFLANVEHRLSPGGERGAMFSFIARGAMPKQMVSLYGE
jgi:hypothetical protein